MRHWACVCLEVGNSISEHYDSTTERFWNYVTKQTFEIASRILCVRVGQIIYYIVINLETVSMLNCGQLSAVLEVRTREKILVYTWTL